MSMKITTNETQGHLTLCLESAEIDPNGTLNLFHGFASLKRGKVCIVRHFSWFNELKKEYKHFSVASFSWFSDLEKERKFFSQVSFSWFRKLDKEQIFAQDIFSWFSKLKKEHFFFLRDIFFMV